MTDEQPDICGAENRAGDPCQQVAGWGTDHVGEGRCKLHGGVTGDNHGPPEGTANAEKHGLRSDSEKWWDRHKDEYADDVIDAVSGWMEDAPFGWDNTGNVKLLVQAAKNECQIDYGDAYIDENGIVVTETKTVTDDGREIEEEKENPALRPKSRLQRDTVRILEKLGVLDDPESQKAEATQDLADVWRNDLES